MPVWITWMSPRFFAGKPIDGSSWLILDRGRGRRGPRRHKMFELSRQVLDP